VRAAGARDRDQITRVIRVTVRDENQIDLADLFRRLRGGRIRRDPRIGEDALAARRTKEKGRVAKPRE
jgi:hypothetical protein